MARRVPATLHGYLQHLALVVVQFAHELNRLEAGQERGERGPQVVDDHVGQAVAKGLDFLEALVVLLEFLVEAHLAVAQPLLLQGRADARRSRTGLNGLGR